MAQLRTATRNARKQQTEQNKKKRNLQFLITVVGMPWYNTIPRCNWMKLMRNGIPNRMFYRAKEINERMSRSGERRIIAGMSKHYLDNR